MTQGMAMAVGVRDPGAEYDLDDNEAMRLIAGGFAESVAATAPGSGGRTPRAKEFRDQVGKTPQAYLKRFPTGPNAAWAREILAAEEA